MAAAWLLVLVTVVFGAASAGPVPTSQPTTTSRGCRMDRFRVLLPTELAAFKKAKDALEESLSQSDWSCASRLFPRSRDLRHLLVWERPVALEAELGLTLKVLGTLADPSLGVVLEQPLGTLHRIHSELQACVPPRPTAGPRPRGRLDHWLHRLQEAAKKETQSCLEASVTFNLFRLLLQDLKCVARGDLCV